MRHKILTAILAVSLFVTGCGFTGDSNTEEEKSQKVGPNIYETGAWFSGYSYVIDKNTGVVYLKYSGSERAGLTVMVNADGTPTTADQLGIEY